MTCLTLNAQTIQGKVVRVSDGDTITILDEAMEKTETSPKTNYPLGFQKDEEREVRNETILQM